MSYLPLPSPAFIFFLFHPSFLCVFFCLSFSHLFPYSLTSFIIFILLFLPDLFPPFPSYFLHSSPLFILVLHYLIHYYLSNNIYFFFPIYSCFESSIISFFYFTFFFFPISVSAISLKPLFSIFFSFPHQLSSLQSVILPFAIVPYPPVPLSLPFPSLPFSLTVKPFITASTLPASHQPSPSFLLLPRRQRPLLSHDLIIAALYFWIRQSIN